MTNWTPETQAAARRLISDRNSDDCYRLAYTFLPAALDRIDALDSEIAALEKQCDRWMKKYHDTHRELTNLDMSGRITRKESRAALTLAGKDGAE